MSLALTIIDHWSDTKRVHVVGTLTASGNYPLNGDIIPVNNPLIKSGSSPIWAVAQGLGGYNYVVTSVPGSTPPAAILRVYADSTGLELVAGAYPAGLIAAPINIHAIFYKNI
jgi:hypothetical protein